MNNLTDNQIVNDGQKTSELETGSYGYTVGREGNTIYLNATKDSIVKYYIDACNMWILSDQSVPPPHPCSLIDQLVQDISLLFMGSWRLERYCKYFRSQQYHYSKIGPAVFKKPEERFGFLNQSYQIDTHDAGKFEFCLSGNMFDPIHPYWNKPVIEYKYTKMKTKEKHEITFRDFGLDTENPILIGKLDDVVKKCSCNPQYFLMSFGRYSAHLCYTCPICGNTYFCDCFRPLRERPLAGKAPISSGDSGKSNVVKYLHGICHVCRNVIPPPIFLNDFLASFFLKKYAPWVYKEAILRQKAPGRIMVNSPELKEAENILREKLGVYRIGEKWVTETSMYRLILTLCGDKYEVYHHARPKFLNGLEYDVFIPELKLALEYDGIQHERPVDFFGGEESYKNTILRDKAKNELSEVNKIRLIRIKDSVSEDKLDSIIREQEVKFNMSYVTLSDIS